MNNEFRLQYFEDTVNANTKVAVWWEGYSYSYLQVKLDSYVEMERYQRSVFHKNKWKPISEIAFIQHYQTALRLLNFRSIKELHTKKRKMEII